MSSNELVRNVKRIEMSKWNLEGWKLYADTINSSDGNLVIAVTDPDSMTAIYHFETLSDFQSWAEEIVLARPERLPA